MLKAGKSKDSCSSQLFTISCKEEVCIPPVDESNKEVLQRDTNLIADLTANPERYVEEIVMKNETDLQQTLDQLLPPKSVFLSTIFLLQDADNIFEMQPADRLTVLKNVFGLLGIDEAKEQVQDKKREISYKLKALQDHSHQDNKLRKWLHELHNNYLSLTSHHCEDESNMRRNNLKTLEPFFADITPFFDQITLNDFTLNGLDIQIFLTTQEELQTQEKSLLTLQTTKDHLTKQIDDLSDQLTK
jgi:DNA repair exonuclease SbcCD ATPase subunit